MDKTKRLSSLANSRAKRLFDQRHSSLKEVRVPSERRVDNNNASLVMSQSDEDAEELRNSIRSTVESLDNALQAVNRHRRKSVSISKKRVSSPKTVVNKKQEPSTRISQYITTSLSEDDGVRLDVSKVHNGKITSFSNRCKSTRLTLSLEDKEQIRHEETKKRNTRSFQTQKRRQKIEKERIEHLQLNSGWARQKRLKKRSVEEKMQDRRVKDLLVAVCLGSRVQLAINTVTQYRAYVRKIQLEDIAARIITRQMRILKFRRYRKRVNGAIFMIGTIFVMKVRLWKNIRRRVASDKVRAFLLSLEDENRRSGGCLALIVKGKKWRAYRMKIIILQRLWRDRMRIISAQVLVIDMQWQREQYKRTEEYIESLFKEGELSAIAENEEIDNTNRTRKIIKLKPVPRRTCDDRHVIKKRLVRGDDLLSIGHIVPTEIRLSIAIDMLRYLRRHYLNRIEQYVEDSEQYHRDCKEVQKRRAVLISFSGNQIANAWANIQHTERELGTLGAGCEPVKPFFHIVLRPKTIQTLISVGEKMVVQVRNAWKPNAMTILPLEYNGRRAAEVHIQEWGDT